MFERISILGQGKGAFSTVYKVKCLSSTELSSDGVTRRMLSSEAGDTSLHLKESMNADGGSSGLVASGS